MNTKKINSLLKIFIFIFLWIITFVLSSVVISKIFNYNFKDVFFIVSIIGFIIAIFSAISGDSMGLSLQGLGLSNAQYNASANFEVNRVLKEKSINNYINTLKIAFSSICLIVSSVVCILINYLI